MILPGLFQCREIPTEKIAAHPIEKIMRPFYDRKKIFKQKKERKKTD